MNESLQTVAAMKPVRRGGGGLGSRTLRKSVREVVAAAIGDLENHQPFTSRREPGRRCPLRRTSQCCGRGEAVGDCVSTATRFFDGDCRPRTARIGYADCRDPGASAPARSDGEHRTGHKNKTELQGGRAQWGERRVCGRRRHRILQLCRMRARRNRKEIGTIAFDAEPGATARS